VARGAFSALSGLTKFASLVVAPLWLTYPDRRPSPRFVAGFVAATLAAFSVVLFEPSPSHELRVFWDRTISWQIGRDAPWSLWDWGQYHARGLPNLRIVQHILQGLLVAGALVVAFFPRHKSPLQLAAFTAALLAGFEICLTYWLYTYIPWFFGFAAIALFAPAAVRARAPVPEEESLELEPQQLDPDAALGRLEAHRQACAHAADRKLRLHADHRVVRACHTSVGDCRSPTRQHACVVRLDVRMRAEHCGHAPVEPARHRDLLARRFRMEVEHDHRRLPTRVVDELVDDLPR
jgi:hypothetical protein